MTLDFYFALRSPYSALASDMVFAAVQSGQISQSVTIRLAPFANTNEQFLDPTSNPAKLTYMLHDLPRLYRARGIPIGMPDPFEVDTQPASKVILAAQDVGRGVETLREVSMLRWSEGQNITEQDTLLEAGRRSGVESSLVLDAIENPDWQSRYEQAVTDTEAAGVFGVPFFIVTGEGIHEPFWGQDRWSMVLDLLDEPGV